MAGDYQDRQKLEDYGEAMIRRGQEAEARGQMKLADLFYDIARNYFNEHARSFVPPVQIGVSQKVGDNYTANNSQGVAQGPNAKVEGETFTQSNATPSSSPAEGIDPKELATDLSRLASLMRDRAKNAESLADAGKVAEAQTAARKGDVDAAAASLAKVSDLALGTTEEAKVETAAKVLKRAKFKVATALERAKIQPWAQLDHHEYLIKAERIGGLESERIWQNLQRYGISMIRLTAYPPVQEVIDNIVKIIGFRAENQNDYTGEAAKDILPTNDGRLSSGDTTSELGFHVDGTQDSHQPALLAFQYVTNAKLGANSKFVDCAGVLASLDEETRNRVLVTLARSDAATFEKLGVKYVGPIFSYSETGSLMCRVRFDSVITVHEECRAEFEILRECFEDDFYPSVYLPDPGDVVIFDNWRVMHARDEIYGEVQRHHRREWIRLPRHEHQLNYQLGIRPVSPAIQAEIERLNKGQ